MQVGIGKGRIGRLVGHLLAGVAAGAMITGPTSDPNVTSMNADGWTVTYMLPPTFDPVGNPKYIYLNRAGFDTNGNATTYNGQAAVITTRVRIPYDNVHTSTSDWLNANLAANGLLHASRCALNTVVYSTDTIVGGATNNSTLISPKPIITWAYPHRRMIGNTLPAEWLAVTACHLNARNGEMVACIEWTISDASGHTLTVKASASVISSVTGDKNAVIVYKPTADVDISSFTNGDIVTAHVKGYPWIGAFNGTYANSSVFDSSQETGRTQAQLFWKNTRAVNYACIDPVGGSAGGVVSTIQATAEATAYQTIPQAMTGLRTARGGAGSDIGGDVILVKGTLTTAPPTFIGANYNTNAALIYQAWSGGNNTNCILSLAASWTQNEVVHLWLNNIGIVRSGAFTIGVKSAVSGTVQFIDSVYDGGAQNVALLGNGTIGYLVNVVMSNYGIGTGIMAASVNCSFRIQRGIGGPAGAPATRMNSIDGVCIVGNKIADFSFSANTIFTMNNTFVGYNYFPNCAATNFQQSLAGSNPLSVTGLAVVQNVYESNYAVGATGSILMGISSDDTLGSMTHICLFNNTFVGSGIFGRWNHLYNETTGTARTHNLCACKNNYINSLNTKHDVFHGISDAQPAEAATWTGGWPFMYGVDCAYNYFPYVDATNVQNGLGSSFAQAYMGAGCISGTGAIYANRLDALFTTYAAVTWNGAVATAGAAFGDYTLQVGSPLIGMVKAQVLKWDLNGAVRNLTNSACGAYKGPAE